MRFNRMSRVVGFCLVAMLPASVGQCIADSECSPTQCCKSDNVCSDLFESILGGEQAEDPCECASGAFFGPTMDCSCTADSHCLGNTCCKGNDMCSTRDAGSVSYGRTASDVCECEVGLILNANTGECGCTTDSHCDGNTCCRADSLCSTRDAGSVSYGRTASDVCECEVGLILNANTGECGCTTDSHCDGNTCCRADSLCSTIDAGSVAAGSTASDVCECEVGLTLDPSTGECVAAAACADGTDMCDDPHLKGLRGQKIDWSGVDGAWYCMIKDDAADIHINVRLTAPLPEEFPNRQLVTGLSVLSEGHSLAIEVKNPYDTDTNGCPRGMSPCLANGGLRAVVDGEEVDDLLRSTRHEHAADGIVVSASNLPVECRQFGGDKIWARMYEEMLQGKRVLREADETFEDWVQRFDAMAAPEWCKLYIGQHRLADVQSIHAVFKIETSSVTVRLNVGTNHQGGGELDWDGRVLPDLEFWQMDVGVQGLSLENDSLSGMLGETARPVLDESGQEIMEGYDAFRGTVEDYRVSGPLGTDFALLENN